MTTLIARIHNVPPLERVTFRHVPIKLADMENLHRRAPNLRSVKLDNVRIYHECSRDLVNLVHAENITAFSIMVVIMPRQEVKEGSMNALNAWISYIGNKYFQLRGLDLCVEHYNIGVANKELTTELLVRTLGNLNHLSSYSVNLFPPSPSVLDMLDANEIRLQHLMIHLERGSSFGETFNIVMASPSTSTLSSLAIEGQFGVNPLAIGRRLIPLCLSLQHLTHLKVDCYFSTNEVFLLVDIIHNLTMLQSLEYGYFTVDMNNRVTTKTESIGLMKYCDDLFYNRISRIKYSNIKSTSLCLSLNCNDGFEKLNGLFNFILLSCSLLEKFDLNAEETGDCDGFVNLDFRRQMNLKQIRIKQRNCRYYTFQHDFRKRWKNVNQPTAEEPLRWEQAIFGAHHTNLAWDSTNKGLDLYLSDCRR